MSDAAAADPPDHYLTPEGLLVFTQAYHLRRGDCCASGCRHCPFGYAAVEQPRRTRLLDARPAPRRIVSLVPSLTELLCDLGLRERVVGCTKFCVHPPDLRRERARVVGGTKAVHVDRVRELAPDLILANREENVREEVLALSALAETWVTDVPDLAAAERLVLDLGTRLGREEEARRIAAANAATLDRLARPGRGSAVYLIWREPYMAAGGGTYVASVLERLGYRNALADERRYPTLTPERLRALAPEHVLLASEPYPFAERHVAELLAILPEALVELVDGGLFSWYGSRLARIGSATGV